jgi:hypothetical protein
VKITTLPPLGASQYYGVGSIAWQVPRAEVRYGPRVMIYVVAVIVVITVQLAG